VAGALSLVDLSSEVRVIVAEMASSGHPLVELGKVMSNLYQRYPNAKSTLKEAGLTAGAFAHATLGLQVIQTGSRTELGLKSRPCGPRSASDSKPMLCKYFASNVCRNGADCRFSHADSHVVRDTCAAITAAMLEHRGAPMSLSQAMNEAYRKVPIAKDLVVKGQAKEFIEVNLAATVRMTLSDRGNGIWLLSFVDEAGGIETPDLLEDDDDTCAQMTNLIPQILRGGDGDHAHMALPAAMTELCRLCPEAEEWLRREDMTAKSFIEKYLPELKLISSGQSRKRHSSEQQNSSLSSTQRNKQIPCLDLANYGSCKYGLACRFSHATKKKKMRRCT
jgi:hypothetical protein